MPSSLSTRGQGNPVTEASEERFLGLDMVVHTCDPDTPVAEAGEPIHDQGQASLQSESRPARPTQ